MTQKKSRQKRTKILIITTASAPDWVTEEFSSILKGLPPKAHCEAATIDLNEAYIFRIQEKKPDWLLVYYPEYAQGWVCELLMWVKSHPKIHTHIRYEKPTAPLQPTRPIRRLTNPAEEPDYILRDFCLHRTQEKPPN
jgi:hypothetical protein